MANIFGVVGASDSDLLFNGTIGNETIYNVASDWLAMQQDDTDRMNSVFVSGDTENLQESVKQVGGGQMQETEEDEAQPAAVKPVGDYQVGYPLWNYSDSIIRGAVSLAYMSAEEMSLQIENINVRNNNANRRRILQRLFNNTQYTFTDKRLGSTEIEPLANGDAVVYPPIEGSYDEATADAYTGTNFVAITDSDDPYRTAVSWFNDHFEANTGNDNIVTFINEAQQVETEALNAFVPVPDDFVITGDDTDVPTRLPFVPGKIIGRHTSGTWIVVWNWVVAAYFMSFHLEEQAPLKRRVDMADSGLGAGLQLVATGAEVTHWPLSGSTWRNRFGIGAGKRLNGRIQQLVASTSYTIPAEYATIP
jgi:hypothetical protein